MFGSVTYEGTLSLLVHLASRESTINLQVSIHQIQLVVVLYQAKLVVVLEYGNLRLNVGELVSLHFHAGSGIGDLRVGGRRNARSVTDLVKRFRVILV